MAGRGTDIILGGNLKAELAKLEDNTPSATITRHKADWQSPMNELYQSVGYISLVANGMNPGVLIINYVADQEDKVIQVLLNFMYSLRMKMIYF